MKGYQLEEIRYNHGVLVLAIEYKNYSWTGRPGNSAKRFLKHRGKIS